MVDHNGNQKVQFFFNLLITSSFDEISTYPPPDSQAEKDRSILGLTPDKVFTVKLAYNLLTTPNHQAPTLRWNVVWDQKGPYRVKVFLWMVLHNGLKTNVKTMECGLTGDNGCLICGACSKSIIHILRDCHLVCSIQDSLDNSFIGFNVDFHIIDIKRWILRNIQNGGRQWHNLNGIALWAISQKRNEVLFQDKVWNTFKWLIRLVLLVCNLITGWCRMPID